ncbi:PXDN [Lepeophtheirus salmonis]|uniref:PXDN n=1 Tax=Lepeophtheirus salmonis TaxID=72036 RepID=A0A7R8HDN2_LEPSM|nr:PXDN [Lepeophtheirus salmonis]CAF3033723.1 PXDN [Lepeophtheirus salmonis]
MEFQDIMHDIDLFVGGFSEERHKDSILGPVFKCILGDQFARLKLGDRYFYDLGIDKNIAFTNEQLNEIRKVSMSRILCDNSDSITMIQPRAFRNMDRRNKLTSCSSSSIPFVGLSVFEDRGTRG